VIVVLFGSLVSDLVIAKETSSIVKTDFEIIAKADLDVLGSFLPGSDLGPQICALAFAIISRRRRLYQRELLSNLAQNRLIYNFA
jgi:hypothetical protein